jgi:hypothetical protein
MRSKLTRTRALGLVAAALMLTVAAVRADEGCGSVPVEATFGSFSPYPVAVGEDATADLSATTEAPSGGTQCPLSGPTWGWTIDDTQYSEDDTSYVPGSPDYIYIDHPDPSSADATIIINSSVGGYWLVTCTATVSFTNECNECWTGSDTKQKKAKAVEIEKIIEDGSMPEDEGPLYTAVGTAVTVRAKPKAPDTFPTGKPTWKVTKKPAMSGVADPAAGATATITPDKPGEYELEATCGTSVKKITIYAIKVVFKEDAAQKYGFDDFTSATEPWKSVEKTKKDPAKAEIDPAAAANKTFFKSSDVAKMKITPATATASPQTVEVEGVAKGEAVAEARAGKADGPIAGKMNVWVREKKTKTVGVRLIHSEKDDIQVIPKGKGKPNTVCITAGGMALVTAPAGDDVVDGTTITTGPDGICNTAAAMGDNQVIPVGNGKSGEVCVHHGVNNKLDTKEAGDDVKDGEDIKTGANGICNTDAATANINSTDVAAADITSYLNTKVYNQAVFEFQVTKLAAKTVRFDLNRDGKIDVDAWMSDEMKAVRDAGDDPGFDYIVFLVDNPSDGSLGFMSFNQKYGFVHADMGNATNTIAHELGHGAFGLAHTPADGDNLMHPTNPAPWRLRKAQWDTINP